MLICYKSKKNNKQGAYNNAKYTALQTGMHCAKQNHVKMTVCLFICCHRKYVFVVFVTDMIFEISRFGVMQQV